MHSRNNGGVECRRIEITLISASDLENVRKRFPMKVYAVVSIAGDSRTERKTPVDEQREIHPAWDYTIKYTIGERALHQDGVTLVIELYCERAFGDRYIGEVRTSIKDLYDQAKGRGGRAILTKNVQSAASQGDLTLSCLFGEKVIIGEGEGGGDKRRKKLLKRGAMILLKITAFAALDIQFPFFLGSDDVW